MDDQTMHECQCANCKNQHDEEVLLHHRQVNLLLSRLNEPQRRWYVGMLSLEPSSRSDVELSLITGLDEKTIRRGRRELEAEFADVPVDRQRQAGAGRPLSEKKSRR